MKASFLCGEKKLELNLPDSARLLETRPVPPLADPAGALAQALRSPLGAPPFLECAHGKTSACVVISDITRPVPNQLILPPLLCLMEQAGIKRENITILIATGMHRPNQGAELESMVGSHVMANYRIENHFCRDDSLVRRVAEIDGAPIELNRHYLDADFKVLTGLIEPHMYAGYSGGRKSLLPGISSFRTMQFMHSFAMIDHPKVTNCVLEGNPFHQAGQKVVQAVGADFLLNVVINKQRQVVGVFAGHWDEAHLAGCRLSEELTVTRLEEPFDLVVTSAGGYPLDASFYQASKGLIMAKNMLRPGGTIVITAECREGLGSPEYCSLIQEAKSPQEFCAHYGDPDNFVIDQWCLQTTNQAAAHAGRILVYSPHLKAGELACMGMEKIDRPQEAVDRLLPDHPRVAAAPEGPYVVGLLQD